MMYEVRYSELAGAYYIRQMMTGEVLRDSYTQRPENAIMRAVRLSGYRDAETWAKAVKEAKKEAT